MIDQHIGTVMTDKCTVWVTYCVWVRIKNKVQVLGADAIV